MVKDTKDVPRVVPVMGTPYAERQVAGIPESGETGVGSTPRDSGAVRPILRVEIPSLRYGLGENHTLTLRRRQAASPASNEPVITVIVAGSGTVTAVASILLISRKG